MAKTIHLISARCVTTSASVLGGLQAVTPPAGQRLRMGDHVGRCGLPLKKRGEETPWVERIGRPCR